MHEFFIVKTLGVSTNDGKLVYFNDWYVFLKDVSFIFNSLHGLEHLNSSHSNYETLNSILTFKKETHFFGRIENEF